jgi:hypothetical protein
MYTHKTNAYSIYRTIIYLIIIKMEPQDADFMLSLHIQNIK